MPPWPSAFPYLYHFSIIVNHHTKNAYLTTRRKHIIHTSESMSHCLITVQKGKFLYSDLSDMFLSFEHFIRNLYWFHQTWMKTTACVLSGTSCGHWPSCISLDQTASSDVLCLSTLAALRGMISLNEWFLCLGPLAEIGRDRCLTQWKLPFKSSVFSLWVVWGFFYRLIYRFRPPAVIIANCSVCECNQLSKQTHSS